MRDKTKTLWELQDQHKGDRWRLFQAGYEGKIWAADLSSKCKKLAITAVMHKLIVMANALLRDGRKWTEIRA